MDKVCNFVASEKGIRLDKYVCGKCPELSRAHVQKLINSGNITVNDHVAKVSLKLNIGDRLTVILMSSLSLALKSVSSIISSLLLYYTP